MSRQLTYCEALNEALTLEMERDPSVIVYGIGVTDHKKIFGSVDGLSKFGSERFFETPLSEDAIVGFGIGAAMNGLRPVNIHIRVDFLLLAVNQLFNVASAVSYCSAGHIKVPIVIRGVIGRGWGQGCQHSKSLQSLFAHIPGLKVLMPTTPHDAKGLLISAIRDNNPVIFLEHRWLYWQKGDVPTGYYQVPIGQPQKIREGIHITLVATSWLCVESNHAAEVLSRNGISTEIIDVRSISPLDDTLIIESVKKTKKCIVLDNDWVHCGFSAELATRIYQKCYKDLDCPIERIGFQHTPCPTTRPLENKFYPNAETIIRTVEKMLDLDTIDTSEEMFYSHENRFKGPF